MEAARPNNNIYSRPGNTDRVAQTQDRAGTRQQPTVARDRANNVYTDRSGNVYRRNDNGSWDRRDKGGWSKTDTPSAGTRPSTGGQPVDPTIDGTQPSTRTLDRDPAVDPAVDRFASVNPAFDRIETVDGQPSFERIHALDELAQP